MASRGHSRGSKRARRPHWRERRRPWRGRPGLGGAGATAATTGDHRRARARGRRPEACPAGLWLPTRSWGVCECWMVLEEAGVALFIGERRGCFGLRRWTPVHGARRRAASVRGREGGAAHAAIVGERGRAQERGEGDKHSAHHTVGLAGPCPCSLQRAPASASARGELRELRGRWWRSLARYGSRGSEHARNRALGGTQSASTRTPAHLDERGHRVDYDIRSS